MNPTPAATGPRLAPPTDCIDAKAPHDGIQPRRAPCVEPGADVVGLDLAHVLEDDGPQPGRRVAQGTESTRSVAPQAWIAQLVQRQLALVRARHPERVAVRVEQGTELRLAQGGDLHAQRGQRGVGGLGLDQRVEPQCGTAAQPLGTVQRVAPDAHAGAEPHRRDFVQDAVHGGEAQRLRGHDTQHPDAGALAQQPLEVGRAERLAGRRVALRRALGQQARRQ